MPDSPPPPRLSVHDAWMLETVRLFEERHGPCEDGVEVRRLPAGPPLERARRRNLALAERLGLPEASRRWQRAGLAGLLLLALAALLSGLVGGRAALGDGTLPVNLFWALAGLLGLPTFTLLLWLISLPWGRRLGSLTARLALRLAGWLAERMPGDSARSAWRTSRQEPARDRPEAAAAAAPATAATAPHSFPGDNRAEATDLLPAALNGLLQRAGLWRALGGLASHGWWLLALGSAWLTLIVLFATRRYGFTWETTLLSPEVFVQLALGLGSVPAWLGFPLPEPGLVARTASQMPLTAGEQALWSRWLLGCVLVWGLLPRLVAGLACLAWSRWRWPQLTPDWNAPGLTVQLARLQGATLPLGIPDPAPGALVLPATARPEASWAATAPTTNAASQVLALELPNDIPWPPADLVPPASDAGNLLDRHQRARLLAHYASQPPEELLIAVDARQTPDRGTLGTLRELSERVPGARLRLYATDPDAPRLPVWRASLEQAGLALVQEVHALPAAAPTATQEEARHD